MTDPPVAGAVLAGGASRRMGRDKAAIEIDGRPLGRIAVDALMDAGVEPVVVIGGASGHGAVLLADATPGSGPLGAVIQAIDLLGTEQVVVLPCDLPHVDPTTIRRLLDVSAHSDAPVVLGAVDGAPAGPIGVWRRGAVEQLRLAFDSGERSLHRALGGLTVKLVELGDAARDADSPGDLPATGTLRYSMSETEGQQ